MNNDLRNLINRLDSIQEGEIGRKVGSTIGGFFGDKAAEVGGRLGDKAGDFLDKVNPFSKSDNDLDKDTAPEKSASDNTVSNGPSAVSTPATVTASDHSPENIQARHDNKFYRPAKFWGDGADPNNHYMDQFKVDPDTEWAKDDWGKIFVNYNGTPIRSSDQNSWPREPKHPYYHFVFSDNAPASVRGKCYGRVALRSLMSKDKYGRTELDYNKPSTQLPIEFNNPKGYGPGDVSQINKQLPADDAKQVAGLRGPNGAAIIIAWRPRNFMPHHSHFDDQIKGAYQDNSADSLKDLADYYGGQLSDSSYVGLDNKLFGDFNGKSFVLSKGLSSTRVVVGLMRVATKDPEGAHTDDIVIRYWGPDGEWKQGGHAALASLVASIRPRNGVNALSNGAGNNSLTNNSSLSEELSRMIELASR